MTRHKTFTQPAPTPSTLSIMLNGFEPQLHARLHKKIVALVNRMVKKHQRKAESGQGASREQS